MFYRKSNYKTKLKPSKKKVSGGSFLEVIVALAIFTFAIIPIIQLNTTIIKKQKDLEKINNNFFILSLLETKLKGSSLAFPLEEITGSYNIFKPNLSNDAISSQFETPKEFIESLFLDIYDRPNGTLKIDIKQINIFDNNGFTYQLFLVQCQLMTSNSTLKRNFILP